MGPVQAFSSVKLKVDPSPSVLRTLMVWPWIQDVLDNRQLTTDPPACGAIVHAVKTFKHPPGATR